MSPTDSQNLGQSISHLPEATEEQKQTTCRKLLEMTVDVLGSGGGGNAVGGSLEQISDFIEKLVVSGGDIDDATLDDAQKELGGDYLSTLSIFLLFFSVNEDM